MKLIVEPDRLILSHVSPDGVPYTNLVPTVPGDLPELEVQGDIVAVFLENRKTDTLVLRLYNYQTLDAIVVANGPLSATMADLLPNLALADATNSPGVRCVPFGAITNDFLHGLTKHRLTEAILAGEVDPTAELTAYLEHNDNSL